MEGNDEMFVMGRTLAIPRFPAPVVDLFSEGYESAVLA